MKKSDLLDLLFAGLFLSGLCYMVCAIAAGLSSFADCMAGTNIALIGFASFTASLLMHIEK